MGFEVDETLKVELLVAGEAAVEDVLLNEAADEAAEVEDLVVEIRAEVDREVCGLTEMVVFEAVEEDDPLDEADDVPVWG